MVMNDTPLSQKPLTGWDDSPQSATASDQPYSRYFSPYSSQYNSPVSAAEGPSNMQWPQNFAEGSSSSSPIHNMAMAQHQYPTAAQEKAMQDEHEAHLASQRNIAIGLALGGDEASLRTQPSQPSMVGVEDGNAEAYELHEVSSAGGSSAGGYAENSFKKRMAKSAPVLQHPGYGRYSPDKMPPPPPLPVYPMYGELTEDDARHGNVV